jgi:hypothetical protein
MKTYRTYLNVAVVVLVVLLAALLQAQTAQGAALRRSTFNFPGHGQPNNNRQIGDFCCTGETAIVSTPNGDAIGYIYFYDFRESYNIGNNQSVAGIFRILVSGVSDMWNLNSERSKSMIEFRATELEKGARRSVTAGALRYTATILKVKHRKKNRKQYYMGSVKAKVEVSLAGSASGGTTGSSGGSGRAVERDVDLAKFSFFLPGDGRRNNNRQIGDFCCTGETVTVETTNGDAAGYIYFFAWKDGRNIGNNQSLGSAFILHVSGTTDLSNPDARRRKKTITFAARELKRGMSRSVRAGALNYTATILKAKLTKNRKDFYFGTVKLRVDVSR